MKLLKKAITIILCIICSMYLYMLVCSENEYTVYQKTFMIVYFVLLLLLVKHIFDKYVGNKMQIKRRNKVLLLSITGIIVLSLCVWKKNEIVPKFYDDKVISVIALNEKNENSESNEVRICEVKINGEIIELTQIPLADGWSYDDQANVLVCYPVNKCPIEISALNAHSITISFIKHGWSGLVEIVGNDTSNIIDLYDANSSTHEYNITFGMSTNIYQKVISYIGFFIISSELIYGIFVFYFWCKETRR